MKDKLNQPINTSSNSSNSSNYSASRINLSSPITDSFSKQIIEFTDFDKYYDDNNIAEPFRLPVKLIKNSSPLDLIVPNPINVSLNYVEYYIQKIFHAAYRPPNHYYLQKEYIDFFNDFLEEKIDIRAEKERLKKEKLDEVLTSLLFRSVDDNYPVHDAHQNKGYIKSLVAKGESKYKIFLSPYDEINRKTRHTWDYEKTQEMIAKHKDLVEELKIRYIQDTPMPMRYTKAAEEIDLYPFISLSPQQSDIIKNLIPNYSTIKVKIFTNYNSPEEVVLNTILNEDYLKLKELQNKISPLETFKSKVEYHSAHMKNRSDQYSLIQVLNKDEGVIKVSDTSHNFLVRFLSDTITKFMPKVYYGPPFVVDEYSGIMTVSINPLMVDDLDSAYYANDKTNYKQIPNKANAGNIFYPENAMLNLFNRNLVKIEKSYNGSLNVKTSKFDSHGYTCYLPSEFIFDLAQLAQSIQEKEENPLTEKLDLVLDKVNIIEEKTDKLGYVHNVLSDNLREHLMTIGTRNTIILNTLTKIFPDQTELSWKEFLESINPKGTTDMFGEPISEILSPYELEAHIRRSQEVEAQNEINTSFTTTTTTNAEEVNILGVIIEDASSVGII
jgi:hypothetical protein